MKYHTKNLLALMFAVLFLSVGMYAQTPGLFKDTNKKGDVRQKEESTVIRSRNIEVNFSLLKSEAKAITVPLFDRKSVRIDLTRSETKLPPSRRPNYLWNGTIAGQPRASAVFAVVGETVVANIYPGDGKIYQIRYTGNGVHSLRQIDQSKFPNEAIPLRPKLPDPGPGYVPAADTCATDPPDSIDVMVVYTDDTRAAAGGTDAMTGEVYLAVEETNQSYINSFINQRLRLVHVAEVNYNDNGNMGAALSELINPTDNVIDHVPPLRNAHGADMVHMILENGSACGLGYYMTTLSNSFEAYAYSVSKRSCTTGYFSFGHELGHNMGADHDLGPPPHTSGPGIYPYNHGFIHPSSNLPDSWRTIMSYPTNPYSDRVQYWSNLSVNYPVNNAAMGTAALENNAQVLNNTALTVANFRCSSPGALNVWMKDSWNDTGAEPNTTGDPMWQSPYIWVRNAQDTGLTHQHQHENPKYGITNYLYVKIHNGSSVPHTGQLDMRFVLASTGLTWPGNWVPVSGTPVTVTIPANSTRIVEVPWSNVPYNSQHDPHYCMVAMWTNDSLDPMAVALGTDINANTANNNNVVWRNMNVVDMTPDAPQDVSFILRNVSKERSVLALAITVPKKEAGNSFLANGRIEVTFNDKLFELVKRGLPKLRPGIKLEGRKFIITDPGGAVFQNIAVPAGFEDKVTLTFRLNKNAPKRRYEVAASQYQQGGSPNMPPQVVGGVSYEIYNYKR